MKIISQLFLATLLLSACGSQPTKPEVDYQLLIAALISQNQPQILAEKSRLTINTRNTNIINLYLLTLQDKPYEVISNSQVLVNNYHQYSSSQQAILKQLLLWAYVHPIYRQETAKQVRLLQRKSLMVAPSKIDFVGCEADKKGCANNLRTQVAHIIVPIELTETLISMAENDPCINLSDENLVGDYGNQCLASRKGTLKINLISKPQFLFDQWQRVLEPLSEPSS